MLISLRIETLIGLDFIWRVPAGFNWGRVLVFASSDKRYALGRRVRCFPSCERGFLRDLDPQTRSQTRRRMRPRTMSSASSFQTASQSLVRFFFQYCEQILCSSFGPLHIVVACFCDCNPPFPSTDLFPFQSTECNIPLKTGSLVLSPGCLKESLTRWKALEYCHILSSSVSLPRFNSLHLISSRLALCLGHTLLTKVPPHPLPATLCYTFSTPFHGTNLLTGDGWTTAWSKRASELIRFKLN